MAANKYTHDPRSIVSYVPGTSSQIHWDRDPNIEPNVPKMYTTWRTGNLKLSIHVPRRTYIPGTFVTDSKLNKPETEITTLYPDTLSHLTSGPTITVTTKFQISDKNM